MKKLLGMTVILGSLAATSAYADCASDVQRLESARLTPTAQEYLAKARENLDKKTHGERDCEAWVDAAIKDMRENSRAARSDDRHDRRYSDDRYDRRDDRYDRRADDRYDRRYDDRYDRRDDRRYDDRGSSGSSTDPLGRLLNGLGR
jgi:hypothetical protein